jgi:2-amino-4-hydroxy-6-hydroxymethyldihydropteridine diphosphokinase
MTRAVLGLGSNLGDRQRHLQHAVDSLRRRDDVCVVAVSSRYETDPVGGPEQPDYLNAVVVVESDLEPRQLLAVAFELEVAAHRDRHERWGPRTLDVDLLAVGDLVIDTPTLTLPHPRARERGFVLLPWREVDPGFCFPDGTTVADAADHVDASGVRLVGDGAVAP